jgi:hypothetical protein
MNITELRMKSLQKIPGIMQVSNFLALLKMFVKVSSKQGTGTWVFQVLLEVLSNFTLIY